MEDVDKAKEGILIFSPYVESKKYGADITWYRDIAKKFEGAVKRGLRLSWLLTNSREKT